MNYTTNYHLPQWVESDRIMMEDFNQMCADMEAGLSSNAQATAAAQAAAETAQSAAETAASKADAAQTTASAAYCPDNMPYVIGTYTGGNGAPKFSLGFRPTAVLVYECYTGTSTEDAAGGFSLHTGGGTNYKLLIRDDGFQVWYNEGGYPYTNRSGGSYIYIAFR